MNRGRKSKRLLAALGALASVACVMALGPAFASAQAANDEYELDVPTPDGSGQDPAAHSSSGNDDGSAPDTSSTGTASTTEEPVDPNPVDEGGTGTDGEDDDAGGAAGKGDDNGKGKGGEGSGAKSDNQGADRSLEPVATSPTSSSSDDGGAPILLIVVGVVAAVCVGLAVWRLRRGGRDSAGVSGRTAEAKPNV